MIAELQRFAVEIFADDLRSDLANPQVGKVGDSCELGPGLVGKPNRSVDRSYVGVVRRDPDKGPPRVGQPRISLRFRTLPAVVELLGLVA